MTAQYYVEGMLNVFVPLNFIIPSFAFPDDDSKGRPVSGLAYFPWEQKEKIIIAKNNAMIGKYPNGPYVRGSTLTHEFPHMSSTSLKSIPDISGLVSKINTSWQGSA